MEQLYYTLNMGILCRFIFNFYGFIKSSILLYTCIINIIITKYKKQFNCFSKDLFKVINIVYSIHDYLKVIKNIRCNNYWKHQYSLIVKILFQLLFIRIKNFYAL